MRLHSPSMSELHAFVATARSGSFTRAAQALCVTQGAISRAVARLEAHFGQALLLRQPAGLVLTEAGRRLLHQVQAPLAAIEQASAGLRQPAGAPTLALAVVPTLASVWLVPRLAGFQRLHPEVTLRFVPYRKDEDFSGNAAPDAALLTGLGPAQWPAWHCDEVIGRQVVPVCHPRRAAARAWATPAALAAEPLLGHTTSPANWALWFQAVGAADVQPVLASAFDQVSILVQAALADMGVALVQRCLVRAEVESGRLAVPFDLPVILPRGYYLCCPPAHAHRPALVAFRQWLLAEAEEDAGRPFTLPGAACAA
ncbi:LysR substrate-binding domain-containing protein [Aquincola tertiaricarbonis]|uniref:LysR substrate-binding domain-containing protein n=1 Tax=Aquincola tertiaricarbonis TaxID=391953 RepID=UPI000614BE6E|nr:LysR substrate-binding domain-containing protein [Aquincola tertiaricarbonis]